LGRELIIVFLPKERMRKPPSFRPLEAIFSLALLAAILWALDIRSIIGIMASADAALVLFALCTYFCTMLLMSHRLRRILSELGEEIRLAPAFTANAAGLLASDFTPARSGYFLTPFVLSKNGGVPVEKGMVAIVSPQIAEFFLKAAGAAAAILLILSSFPEISGSASLLWAGVGVMLAFCAALWAALFSPSAVRLASRLEFLPFVAQGRAFLESLQSHRHRVARIFPWIAAVSVVIFVLKGVEWYFFGLALRIGFAVPVHPFFVFLVLQPLITVFQFVPFPTIAGLGLSEGSAVASMAILGVPVEVSVAYALLVRAGTTLLDCIGIGQLLPFFFRKG
jgi:uncharacterized protein (TIRG00374 family)